jgi:hypothetical protein
MRWRVFVSSPTALTNFAAMLLGVIAAWTLSGLDKSVGAPCLPRTPSSIEGGVGVGKVIASHDFPCGRGQGCEHARRPATVVDRSP